ncbi:hypothetical protein J437_LFUL003817 [Ladona fulva]|uniref:Transposase n=1 Tax=Ladona fulva TaxID=123851 RepID=A0A8K0KEY0_LADFU|nr:hypothetical protein J437_LFUL003817 [Ladona fulva]
MPPRESKNFDRLFKIQPLLNQLSEKLPRAFSPNRYLSINESMVAIKGRSSMKQYMPMKPIKRGFKVWVMCCAVTGFMVAFDVYTGKEVDGSVRNISIYKWLDRGKTPLCVVSSMHNPSKPEMAFRRNSVGDREEVLCPEAIADYNKYMGGVDKDSRAWFADGTFKITPPLFSQVYVILGEKHGGFHPMVYALLPSKSHATYDKLFGIIKGLQQGLQPAKISCDFEITTFKSMRKHFPNARIQGCFI